MQETHVQTLGQEDPLEKEMATHSRILVWKIPLTEKPGRLQSIRLQTLDMTYWLNHHQKSVLYWYRILDRQIFNKEDYRKNLQGEYMNECFLILENFLWMLCSTDQFLSIHQSKACDLSTHHLSDATRCYPAPGETTVFIKDDLGVECLFLEFFFCGKWGYWLLKTMDSDTQRWSLL